MDIGYRQVPTAWKQSRDKRWLGGLAVVFFGIFAILWGYQAVVAIVEGRYVYGLFYFPAAVAVTAVIMNTPDMIRSRMRSVPSANAVHCNKDGVAFSRSRWARWTLMTYLVAACWGCLAFSIGMFTHAYEFPMTAGQGRFFPYVIGAMGAYLIVYLCCVFTGQIRSSRVICTPFEVIVRSTTETQSVEWDRIDKLEPFSMSGGPRHSMISMVTVDGSKPQSDRHYRGPFASALKSPPTITVKADQFAVGAVPLYWFLRYYLEHPEDRPELADGRAVDRLLSGALVL
ncbi:hypothetical protein ABI214_07085 [Prescottella soli]|uniref:Uncharacterized protein n=1 Tax=Prescottella soli TaxID=1543852 RepID=A0ABW9FRX5_9NOCA